MSQTFYRDPNSYFSRHINEIEKKYILKKWKDNPEKLLEYLDMKNNYWRKMRNELPNNEFEKSFVYNLYKNYGTHKDLIKEIITFSGDAVGQRNPILGQGLKFGNVLIEAGNSFADMEKQNRIDLAEGLMSDSNTMTSLINDLNNRPIWNQAIGEGVSYSDGKLKEAWEDVMKSDYEYFYGKDGLAIPSTPEEIIKDLSPYDQYLYAFEFDTFLKADIREFETKKINKLEKDLEGVSIDLKSLKDSFNSFIENELKKEKEEQKKYKEQLRLADYKGYGQLLGFIVGINNPKLGKDISEGTSAIIDAYTSFNQISIVENALSVGSIASMASGVGSFLTVVSIIQGLNSSGDEQTAEMLMKGLAQINENINQLRDEIKQYFKQTFEELSNITDALKTNAVNIDEKLNYITTLINEFTKRELESDFQTLNNDIYSEYESLYSDSTKQQVNDILNKLYVKALNYSSIEKYTRVNELHNSLYDYLDLYPQILNDSFKWSPTDYRPVLILNIVTEIIQLDVDTYFKEKYKNEILEEIIKYKNNPPLTTDISKILTPFSPTTLSKKESKNIFDDPVMKYYSVKEMSKTHPFKLHFELVEPEINIFFVSPLLIKLKNEFNLFNIKKDLENLKLNSFLKFPDNSNVEFKIFNPILCSRATIFFSQALSNAYITNKLSFDEFSSIKYKNSISDKFSNLYGANIWFYSIVNILDNGEILKYFIEKYLKCVTELHHYLFQNLNFKANDIKDEVDKISFHNLLNSKIFIESNINSTNCYLPSLQEVEHNYNEYKNVYSDKLLQFSNCIRKFNNISINQEIIDLSGRKGTDTNQDFLYTPLHSSTTNNNLQLSFTLKDDYFVDNLIKFQVHDKRNAEIEKLNIEITDHEYGDNWKKVKIKYIDSIGKGNDIYVLNNPRKEFEKIAFVYYDPWFLTLSKGIFQEDLFERLKTALHSENNIVDHFLSDENENLKLALSFPSSEVNSFNSINTNVLNQLIENVRKQWNKLTTTLLCKSNSTKDFTTYFNMLDNKPSILSLPTQLNENLIYGITGIELEKLYLINSVILANSKKELNYFGLRILEPKIVDNIENTSSFDMNSLSFNEINFFKDKETSASEFKIDNSIIETIYNAYNRVSENPTIMPSITSSTEEAIIECENLMNMIYSLNYDILK